MIGRFDEVNFAGFAVVVEILLERLLGGPWGGAARRRRRAGAGGRLRAGRNGETQRQIPVVHALRFAVGREIDADLPVTYQSR